MTIRPIGCQLADIEADMERYPMAVEARIRELGRRHRNLDKMIEDVARYPAFDDLKLRQLKREKPLIMKLCASSVSGSNMEPSAVASIEPPKVAR